MKEITLELTIEEANLILEALGNMPFSRVYQLIGKLQEQASEQVQSANGQAETQSNSKKKDQPHD